MLGFWPEMCWSQVAAVENPDVMARAVLMSW